MKIRKSGYGESNLVGKNIEFLRKKKGIKQKDFISKKQNGCCIKQQPFKFFILLREHPSCDRFPERRRVLRGIQLEVSSF